MERYLSEETTNLQYVRLHCDLDQEPDALLNFQALEEESRFEKRSWETV